MTVLAYMKRRHFLQTLTAGSVIGLSGCATLNPFDSDPTPPTEAQLEYIEYYPYHKELQGVTRITLSRQEDSVGLEPVAIGPFESFEVYVVQPDGGGEQVGTITQEEYQSGEVKGSKPFSLSTTQGGSVLLIIGLTPKGKRYTYGAFYYAENGFKQVAYVDRSKSTPEQ